MATFEIPGGDSPSHGFGERFVLRWGRSGKVDRHFVRAGNRALNDPTALPSEREASWNDLLYASMPLPMASSTLVKKSPRSASYGRSVRGSTTPMAESA
jgi:hypothetical protein